MARLDTRLQADVCDMLGYYFCATVGLGPYAAEVSGLRQVYNFTSGRVLNKEIITGLFERTLHTLWDEGKDACLAADSLICGMTFIEPGMPETNVSC